MALGVDFTQNLAQGPTVFPCATEPELRLLCVIDDEITTLDGLAPHTRTHVDAPSLLVSVGVTLADISFERICVPVVVVDVRGLNLFTQERLLVHRSASAGRRVPVDVCCPLRGQKRRQHPRGHIEAAHHLGAAGVGRVGLVTDCLVGALDSTASDGSPSALQLSLGAADGRPAPIVLIEES